MRFGRRGAHRYDFVLIAIAAAIVYPDKVLDWFSELTGKAYGWIHLIVYEIFAIGALIGTMAMLMSAHPALEWWRALVSVGIVAAFRLIMWLVMQLFGFDD